MQLAVGDGDGVAVVTVDVLVVVAAVDGAATAAEDEADDEVDDVVALDDVVLVDAAHHTGDGFGTDIVAVPTCAPWKLAFIVPSESYVPLTRGSTLLSDE